MVIGASPGFSFDSAGWYQASDCSMFAMMFRWQQRRALAQPGGAAGVLQEGDVVVAT